MEEHQSGTGSGVVMQIVGWSDLALFTVFEIGHIAADQAYFNELNSKKISKFGSTRGKIFHFQKSQGPLIKINIFRKFANTFLLLQKESRKKFKKTFPQGKGFK